MAHVLPDLLAPGLKVVICGSAAGKQSAIRSAYYANPRNRFWSVLAEVGLTPKQLRPEEFMTLRDYGIGLTDLAKTASGNDAQLQRGDFGVEMLRDKIQHHRPRVLAFNGLKSARVVLGTRTTVGRYGSLWEGAVVFVLPSTSPGNCDPKTWSISSWHELAKFVS